MGNKANEQIRKMKEQTIGVEVEMNNITRERASMLAAGFFGTDNYAHTGQGYDTWSAWDNQGREWKFARDVSITGPENCKCEMVTPILNYEDIEMLQELIRVLRRAGAKSSPSRGCGVHIHIGAAGHTAQTLRNLTNIMASHESLLIDSIMIESYRHDNYCRSVDKNFLQEVNKKKPATMDKLEDIWYVSQGCDSSRHAHYNQSRYHMLNLHATFTKGTIEFRCFQFDEPTARKRNGMHAGQLKAYIQLCLAMSQMAKDVKKASPNEPQVENPKFAMRTWLVRMGMIGDEFKTAREILTKRLAGNSAWRYGVVA